MHFLLLIQGIGEGALQALRGSSVGLGTDIGERPVDAYLPSRYAKYINRWFSADPSEFLWDLFDQAYPQQAIVPQRC